MNRLACSARRARAPRQKRPHAALRASAACPLAAAFALCLVFSQPARADDRPLLPSEKFGVGFYAHDMDTGRVNITDHPHIYFSISAWCLYATLNSLEISEDGGPWRCCSTGCHYCTVSEWDLAPGDGIKTITIRVKNALMEVTESTTRVLLDTTPPTGSIQINNGAAATGSRDVYLTLELADAGGVASVGLRNQGDAEFQWFSFQPPADEANATRHVAGKHWQLTPGDGEKTVEYVVRDFADHTSPIYSDSIVLDSRPIEGTVTLTAARVGSDGKTYVNELTTLLEVAAVGPVVTFKLKNSTDPAFPDLQYPYPVGPVVWDLAAGPDGPRTVQLSLLDWRGDPAASAETSVILDRAAPTCELFIDQRGDPARALVDLRLIATDATSGVESMCFRYDERGPWTECQSYQTSISWLLEPPGATGEGLYRVTLEALVRDRAGNGKVCSAQTDLLVDETAPQGWVGVATGGSIYVGQREVTLTLTAHDNVGVAEMRLANDPDPLPETRQPFARSAGWTLSEGDGAKTVRAQFRDFAGNTSPVYSTTVILDTQAPSGTVTFDGGAATTSTPQVTLKAHASDGGGSGVRHVRLRNQDGAWSEWLQQPENATHSIPWVLPSGDGPKTVVAQFRDGLGWLSAEVSASIQLNANPPVGTLVINYGDAVTNSKDVTLTVWANAPGSEVAEMRFASAIEDWSAPEPYPPGGGQRAFSLFPAEDGIRVVRVQYRTAGGEWSEPVSATILLDRTRPEPCGLVIDDGAARTGQTQVSLRLCGSDAGSGLTEMRLCNIGPSGCEQWSDWEPFATERSWHLSPNAAGAPQDQPKTVYFELRDRAGNVSTCGGLPACRADIRLDTKPPSGTLRIVEAESCPVAANACVRQSQVHLSYTVTDEAGVAEMRFRNQHEPWKEDAWLPFFSALPLPWELAPKEDGAVKVYAQFKDGVGNVVEISTSTIALDLAGPTGSVVINDGAEYTNSERVTLTLEASDRWQAIGVRIKDLSAADWPSSGSYSPRNSTDTRRDFTFSPGDGVRGVQVQYRDTWQNESVVYQDAIILDTTPPELQVEADQGASTNASGVVTLALSASDALSGVESLRLRNENESWSAWEPFVASKTWTLAGGTGERRIEVEVRDRAGNRAARTVTVCYDADAPTGTLVINGGAASTSSAEVTLTMTASDVGTGVSQMSLRNDAGEWSPWEPFASTRTWTLAFEPGERTVALRLRDVAGRTSEPIVATILYDHPPVAHSGGPYRLPRGSAVVLDASASTDADLFRGDELQFAWDLTGSGAFDDRTGATVTVSWDELASVVCGGACLSEHPYPIAVQVTDRWGLSSRDATTLTVHDNRPRARARALPEPAPCREPITLDSSESFHDNESLHLVSYEWDLSYDGTFDPEVSGQTVTHAFTRFGLFHVALRVTDDNTPSASDVAVLEVLVGADNEAPVAALQGPWTPAWGRGVTLDASGSHDVNAVSADGRPSCDAIVAYRWDLDGDGAYDDAMGATLPLTFADLEARVCGGAGACLPHVPYPIAVEVEDTLGATGRASSSLTFGDPPAATCGDSRCENGETSESCPRDCDLDALGVAWGASLSKPLPRNALATLGVRSVAFELRSEDVPLVGEARDFSRLDVWLESLAPGETALLRVRAEELEDHSSHPDGGPYYTFVYEVARRAAPKVRYFEGRPLDAWTMNAAASARLARAFYRAVKAAAPSAVVVLGAMDLDSYWSDFAAELAFDLATDDEPDSFDMVGIESFTPLYPHFDAMRQLHAILSSYPEFDGKPFVVSAYGGPVMKNHPHYSAEVAALLESAAMDACVLSSPLADLPSDVRMFTYGLSGAEGAALQARRDEMQVREQAQRTLAFLAAGAHKVFWQSLTAEPVAVCDPPVYDPLLGTLRLADLTPAGELAPRPTFASFQRLAELLGDFRRVRRLASDGDVLLYEIAQADGSLRLATWHRRDPFLHGSLPPFPASIAVPWEDVAVENLLQGPVGSLVATGGRVSLELTDTPVFLLAAKAGPPSSIEDGSSPDDGDPPQDESEDTPLEDGHSSSGGLGESGPADSDPDLGRRESAGQGALPPFYEGGAPASGCSAAAGGAPSWTGCITVLLAQLLLGSRRGRAARRGQRRGNGGQGSIRLLSGLCGVLAAGLLACGADPEGTADGGHVAQSDVGGDPSDAGPDDAGSTDVGPADTGPGDTGWADVGPDDAGSDDAGSDDAGFEDAGHDDGGPGDAGLEDVGPGDTGWDDAGPGDTGPDGGVIPEDSEPPVTGSSLSFRDIGYDAVTVFWDAASDAQSAPGALAYRLVRAASAEAIDTIAEAAAVHGYAVALDWSLDTTWARVEGLWSGAEYWFAVLVSDEAGNLALYAPKRVRLQDVSAPAAPSITLECLGYDSVWVLWEPGRGAGGQALEYRMAIANSPEAIDTPEEVDAVEGDRLAMDWKVASAHLLTDLAPDTTYYVAVLARDSVGRLSWVYPQGFTTAKASPPVPGGPVQVDGAPTETTAKLRWGAASEPHVEYRVVVDTDLSRIDTVLEVSTAPGAHRTYQTTLDLNELAPATRYWASVMAKDFSGFAALYEPATFHTVDRNPPKAGTPIVFTEQGADWVRFTWGPAEDETAPERLEYKAVWSFIREDIDTAEEVRVYQGRTLSGVVIGAVVLDWTPGATSAKATGLLTDMRYFAVVVRDVGPYPEDPGADPLRGHALYGPAEFSPGD